MCDFSDTLEIYWPNGSL